MAKMDSRLEKIEGALSPRQFVYRLVDQMMAFDSLDECSLHFCVDGWKSLDKNDSKRLFEAIEAKMKREKKDPEMIRRVLKKASNEMMFLHYLYVRMCSRFIEDKYRHSYNRLYLDVTLLTMRADPDEEAEEKTERLLTGLKVWKHRATRHLHHLYSEKLVAEEIGKRYFDGRDLLHKAERELLESMIQSAERHIEKVNAVNARDEDGEIGVLPYLVDPETVKQEVLAHLEEAIQYEVDMAKAKVYSDMEKTEKSFAILGKYAKMELAWLKA